MQVEKEGEGYRSILGYVVREKGEIYNNFENDIFFW